MGRQERNIVNVSLKWTVKNYITLQNNNIVRGSQLWWKLSPTFALASKDSEDHEKVANPFVCNYREIPLCVQYLRQ